MSIITQHRQSYEDNYDNVNGNSSAEENNLISKTGERCVQNLSQAPHFDSGVTAVISVVKRS